ncbi:hypothetical protein BaRGS_00019603 [Batillaria attramentaria]|uniref:Uncharacterized protein n=1 Tax=Batillaria attramentaria TaxID=370345 RepID=A0ABD0KPM8_9CAEN
MSPGLGLRHRRSKKLRFCMNARTLSSQSLYIRLGSLQSFALPKIDISAWSFSSLCFQMHIVVSIQRKLWINFGTGEQDKHREDAHIKRPDTGRENGGFHTPTVETFSPECLQWENSSHIFSHFFRDESDMT